SALLHQCARLKAILNGFKQVGLGGLWHRHGYLTLTSFDLEVDHLASLTKVLDGVALLVGPQQVLDRTTDTEVLVLYDLDNLHAGGVRGVVRWMLYRIVVAISHSAT